MFLDEILAFLQPHCLTLRRVYNKETEGRVAVVVTWLAPRLQYPHTLASPPYFHYNFYTFCNIFFLLTPSDVSWAGCSCQEGQSVGNFSIFVSTHCVGVRHRTLPWTNLGSKRNKKRQRYPKEHLLLHQRRL